ncbi:PREDICTED: poly [ADP-ribose] polymerase 9, partial [Dipodomys ordii]|uniref:Poly [ADP-ribose] polymerase 9 n=1 Tax=Dipodomys ordii TaxID=10020 RepID=A0A1S3FDU5_DIPOR
FSQGVGAAASSKSSDTTSLEENYTWLVSTSHDAFQILKKNESLLCEVLLKKFGCVSTLFFPALEGNSKSLVEPVFRKRPVPGLELSVWKDDLTKHVVDAVVNAANEDLLHVGGLAGALERAGGPDIREESRRFVTTHGKIPVGMIAVTGAGKLPCRKIIHAVGPQWHVLGPELSKKKLQNAIINILNYVNCRKSSIRTIAIPALGSGIYQVPVDLCTRIILETIYTYLQKHQVVGHLQEIHLVSNEERTVAAFKAASEFVLGENERDLCKSQETTPPFNTKLQLVQGHIEQQKSDVIVNSISGRSLKVSLVSKAILQQAGEQMERHLREKIPTLSSDSLLVLVTEGFKLSCQYVFHIIWHSSNLSPQTLREAMKKCLKNCLDPPITSISFPAFGIGNMGMMKDEAAEIMFDEVLAFAKNHPTKQLTVKFVIFPEDRDTYVAFKAEMTKFNSHNPNDNNVFQWTTEEQRINGLEAGSPTVNLMGATKEKMQEAEVWIKRLLTFQDHHVIENNHILYLGKKEHEKLALLQKTASVSITEAVCIGKTYLEIKGDRSNLMKVVMKVECMLCDVQEEVIRKNEKALYSFLAQWTGQHPKLQNEKILYLRYLVPSCPELQREKKIFEKWGLQVIKVEELQNPLLMAAYQEKKKIMEVRTQQSPVCLRAFQQVPYQFLDAVCRVGFHRFYTASYNPQYGAGIYFTTNLKNLADKVKTSNTDKFIYVFEAEVLKGSSCPGHRSNIVPPPLSREAVDCYDSVVDNESMPETVVIFNGMQALPQYLWICTQDHAGPQGYSTGPVSSSGQDWKKLSNGSSVD